jgi:hypothetical protein
VGDESDRCFRLACRGLKARIGHVDVGMSCAVHTYIISSDLNSVVNTLGMAESGFGRLSMCSVPHWRRGNLNPKPPGEAKEG